jgi:hypothetical protein
MRIVKAPEDVIKADGEITLFVAGGITDCPDWQAQFFKLMKRELGKNFPIVLMSPRRDDFDVSNPDETVKQIKWEFDHLQPADIIVFWFCKETLCPIVLYELGVQMGRKLHYNGHGTPKIFIGVEKGYERAEDIAIQTQLVNDHYVILSSVEDLARTAAQSAKIMHQICEALKLSNTALGKVRTGGLKPSC